MNATKFVNQINMIRALSEERTYAELWAYAMKQAVDGNFAPAGALITASREAGVWPTVSKAFATLGFSDHLTARRAETVTEWKGLPIEYTLNFKGASKKAKTASREAVAMSLDFIAETVEVAQLDEVQAKADAKKAKAEARKTEHSIKMANDTAYRLAWLKKASDAYASKMIEAGFSQSEVQSAAMNSIDTHYSQRAQNVAPALQEAG